MRKNKLGGIMHDVIIHLILIALIFGLFYVASMMRVNSRGVRQQVLEKQIALLIDSADVGIELEIMKENKNGFISGVELKEGKVFVYVAGLTYSKGYPYFSQHDIYVESLEDKFLVRVG